LFALKGGNTNEFWKYDADSDKWTQQEDMPVGGGKRVKGGGSMSARMFNPQPEPPGDLFAFRGNNTPEFYTYQLSSLVARPQPLAHGSLQSAISEQPPALQIVPNPFTNATTISYTLPTPGNISLKLYDVTGKLVATLASGHQDAGTSLFALRSSHLSAGIYLLQLETDNTNLTQKLIIE
jgi:hypothetical protein